MDKYYVVTFQNAHEAMNGEKVAKENSVRVQVMPTPTYITKSCGISLKIKEESIEDIKNLINLGKMKIKNLYVKDGQEVSTII